MSAYCIHRSFEVIKPGGLAYKGSGWNKRRSGSDWFSKKNTLIIQTHLTLSSPCGVWQAEGKAEQEETRRWPLIQNRDIQEMLDTFVPLVDSLVISSYRMPRMEVHWFIIYNPNDGCGCIVPNKFRGYEYFFKLFNFLYLTFIQSFL